MLGRHKAQKCPLLHLSFLGLLVLSLVCAFSNGIAKPAHDGYSRPAVSVEDAIRMTKIGDPEYWKGGSPRELVKWSPDGKNFIIVLRKGDIERNTNEYRMLLWQADEVLKGSPPSVLLTMGSSSNRPAIEDITWLSDNNTVYFLGERPAEHHGLYMFNILTRVLTQITRHPTDILSYSATPDGAYVAYLAESPVAPYFDSVASRQGLVVSTQLLYHLLKDRKEGSAGGQELFAFTNSNQHSQVQSIGRVPPYSGRPYMAPDGRQVLIATQVDEIPDAWKGYSAAEINMAVREKLRPGQFTPLKTYRLIDGQTGTSRQLISAPISFRDKEVVWSPDSRSIAISGVYLPLDVDDAAELRSRQANAFVVEVEAQTGHLNKISQEDLRLLRWQSSGNALVAQPRNTTQAVIARSELFFRRLGTQWTKSSEITVRDTRPKIILEEDFVHPPRIVAMDTTGHQKSLLFDLNPRFNNLEFATVEEIHWIAPDRRKAKGGLYYPVGYVPGRRYPLVIQTHGWRTDRFWIDGPWTSAFAAQPLAGRGMMVLQTEEDFVTDVNTPREVDRQLAIYEGAIEFLDKKGLIVRDQIGIIGFSRTCLFVKYALTHSKYHFAAASVQDGFDGGYFQYVVVSNATPTYFFDGIYGGPPFGDTLKSWLERAPGFSIARVHTPVRIVAVKPSGALAEWEWFAALTRLSKPVEMIVIADGVHILEKPWDRMVSQQGNVDWFAFWLKDDEDPDPAKAEQYARWRELRKLHQQNEKKPATPSPN